MNLSILKKIFLIPRLFILLVLRLYQYILSPLLPPSCRFYPCCSAYSMEAIEHFGIIKGSFLSIVRIMKCNPLHKGGYDPVLQKPANCKQPS